MATIDEQIEEQKALLRASSAAEQPTEQPPQAEQPVPQQAPPEQPLPVEQPQQPVEQPAPQAIQPAVAPVAPAPPVVTETFGDIQPPAQIPTAQKEPAYNDKATSAQGYFKPSADLGFAATQTRGKVSLTPEQIRASDASKILKGSGNDEQKTKDLKALYPDMKIKTTEKGKVAVINGKELKVFKKGTEGFDELPYMGAGSSWRSYSTDAGKQGAVSRMIKGMIGKGKVDDYLTFDRDAYGNMVAVIKKQIGEGWRTFKKGKYYLDAPGLTFKDIHSISPVIDDMKYLIAGGKGIGKLGWFKGSAASGTIGAGGELLNQAQRGESDMDMVAAMGIGAALGEVAGRVIFKSGSAAYGAIRGIIKRRTGKNINVAIDAKGNFKPDTAKILEEKGIGPGELASELRGKLSAEQLRSLTKEQAVKSAEFKVATGESGTPGQIMRKYEVMQHEASSAEIIGVGDKLRAKRIRQDKAIVRGIEKMRDETGGTADRHVFGQRGKSALMSEYKKRGMATTKAYEKAAAAAGNKALIAKSKFSENMKTVLDEWDDAIPGAIKKRITEFVDGVKPLTLQNVEKNLVRFINKRLYASADKTVRKGLGELQNSLRNLVDDMGTRSGKAAPLYKVAKATHRVKLREFESKDIISKIVQGKKIDENILGDLMKSNVSVKEFQKTVAILNRSKNGRQAVKDMRASMMDDVVKAAKINQGDGEFTIGVEALRKHVDKLIDARKIHELFTTKQIEHLNLLVRVADYTKFPSGVYPKGSASTLINFFEKNKAGLLMGKWLAPLVTPVLDKMKEGMARKVVEKSVTRKGTQAIISKHAARKAALRRKVAERKLRRRANVLPTLGTGVGVQDE